MLSLSKWLSSLPADAQVEAGVACRDGRWRVYLRANRDGIYSRQEFSSRTKALKHMVEVMASG